MEPGMKPAMLPLCGKLVSYKLVQQFQKWSIFLQGQSYNAHKTPLCTLCVGGTSFFFLVKEGNKPEKVTDMVTKRQNYMARGVGLSGACGLNGLCCQLSALKEIALQKCSASSTTPSKPACNPSAAKTLCVGRSWNVWSM